MHPLMRWSRLQARLLQELPSLAELPGENVRLAAAQLSAFVPCSILEAEQPAAGGAGANGDAGSDAEMVVVDREPPRSGASTESLEAMPAGAGTADARGLGGGLAPSPLCSMALLWACHRLCCLYCLYCLRWPHHASPARGAGEGALLVLPCSGAALRQAAVAYLDGLVIQVGAAPRWLVDRGAWCQRCGGGCCARRCAQCRGGGRRLLLTRSCQFVACCEDPLARRLCPASPAITSCPHPLLQFDRSVDRMFAALRSGEAGSGVRGSAGGNSGAATPPLAAAAAAAGDRGAVGALDTAALAAVVDEVAAAAAAAAAGMEAADEEGEEGGASALMSEDEGVVMSGPGEAEAAVAAGGANTARADGGLAVKGSPEYQTGKEEEGRGGGGAASREA